MFLNQAFRDCTQRVKIFGSYKMYEHETIVSDDSRQSCHLLLPFTTILWINNNLIIYR